MKKNKAGPSIVGFLAPILAQTREQICASVAQNQRTNAGSDRDAEPDGEQLKADMPEGDRGSSECPDAAPQIADVAQQIGPAPRPDVPSPDGSYDDIVAPGQEKAENCSSVAPRRVLGPSLPPAAYEPADPEQIDDDVIVGPIPPEIAAEADLAAQDVRTAEVDRILKLQRESEKVPDPYCILGIEVDATPADIKKAYMRRSLLIHPDKCEHPLAAQAFQELSKAAKELQVGLNGWHGALHLKHHLFISFYRFSPLILPGPC